MIEIATTEGRAIQTWSGIVICKKNMYNRRNLGSITFLAALESILTF